MTTCGLAPAQARKASRKALAEVSKPIFRSRLNSASNPDAVVSHLSGVGLSRANIAAIVNANPVILNYKESLIGPRLLALRDRVGLSTPQMARLLQVRSRALSCRDVGRLGPNLEFFISFFGSFEKLLVATERNHSLLTADLERVIKPNIALLRQCGLSARDIVHPCLNRARILTYGPERLMELVLRAEELGVPRSSPVFMFALSSVVSNSKEKVAARLEILEETLSCSATEVATAVSRMPAILGISEDHLRRKVQFLISEAGFEPKFIVTRPFLLGYSLEKRLLPRYRVMKILQSKGLLKDNMTLLYSVSIMKKETFKLNFVDRHKDSIPGITDAYAAACATCAPPKSSTVTSRGTI